MEGSVYFFFLPRPRQFSEHKYFLCLPADEVLHGDLAHVLFLAKEEVFRVKKMLKKDNKKKEAFVKWWGYPDEVSLDDVVITDT